MSKKDLPKENLLKEFAMIMCTAARLKGDDIFYYSRGEDGVRVLTPLDTVFSIGLESLKKRKSK